MYWFNYDGMLPAEPIKGKRGYYPVCTFTEWDQLPALYKAMEWSPVPDYLNKGKLSAIKSVVFDVAYMEPYKISAKVSVHREDVQKLLYCHFENTQCHLYSVCGVELESGSYLGAKWLQDSTTGSFGIYVGGNVYGRQGGFQGFIPSCIERDDDGVFWHKGYSRGMTGNIVHYEVSNPFPAPERALNTVSLESQIADAKKASQNEAPEQREQDTEFQGIER